MSTATPAVTSFTGGEWSPRLYGRADLAKYGSACSELVNMSLMPHGPAVRRMGTYYVEQAGSSRSRLLPFVFSSTQAYVLELCPGKIRFFRDGGYLAGKDINTPWSVEQYMSLSFCQAADVMYMFCASTAPRKLMRTGADTFELQVVQFTAQPAEWGDDTWPGCGTFFQQRLWLGGVPGKPNKLWASRTGDFQNFSGPTAQEDDDSDTQDASMSFSLVSEQVNDILWFVPGKRLIAGTGGGEWLIGDGNGSVTPENIQAVLNSNYGSTAVTPLSVGASIVAVSADSRRLYSLTYDYGSDSHIVEDLSLLAEHLTRPGIVSIANQQNPDGIVWCVMQDGTMAGCTWLKQQEVVGWHRFETKGLVRSVCCIPADGYTATWLLVERRNGPCIEMMAAPWDRVQAVASVNNDSGPPHDFRESGTFAASVNGTYAVDIVGGGASGAISNEGFSVTSWRASQDPGVDAVADARGGDGGTGGGAGERLQFYAYLAAGVPVPFTVGEGGAEPTGPGDALGNPGGATSILGRSVAGGVVGDGSPGAAGATGQGQCAVTSESVYQGLAASSNAYGGAGGVGDAGPVDGTDAGAGGRGKNGISIIWHPTSKPLSEIADASGLNWCPEVCPYTTEDDTDVAALRGKNGMVRFSLVEAYRDPLSSEKTVSLTESAVPPMYVDCGLFYTGEPVRTLHGLEHLEGYTVAVLADGAEHPLLAVNNGSITLDAPASHIVVGLPYRWIVAPMRIEGISPRGAMQGKKALVNAVIARFYMTGGVSYTRAGGNGSAYTISFRDGQDFMDSPPPLFTGSVRLPLPGGWNEDTRVRFYGDGVLPVSLLMIIPEVTINN